MHRTRLVSISTVVVASLTLGVASPAFAESGSEGGGHEGGESEETTTTLPGTETHENEPGDDAGDDAGNESHREGDRSERERRGNSERARGRCTEAIAAHRAKLDEFAGALAQSDLDEQYVGVLNQLIGQARMLLDNLQAAVDAGTNPDQVLAICQGLRREGFPSAVRIVKLVEQAVRGSQKAERVIGRLHGLMDRATAAGVDTSDAQAALDEAESHLGAAQDLGGQILGILTSLNLADLGGGGANEKLAQIKQLAHQLKDELHALREGVGDAVEALRSAIADARDDGDDGDDEGAQAPA